MTDTNQLKQNGFLHVDSPIEHPEEDILGRAPFASNLARSIMKIRGEDSMVFGISGEWGAGKSSVLNMIERYILESGDQEPPIVVRFNPWWFSGCDQLLPMFFSQLSESIGRIDSSERTKRLGNTILSYARALRLFGYWPGFGAVKDAMDAVAEGAGVIIDSTEQRSGDVYQLRTEIEEHLRVLGRRIVVIMDDLDRMTSREMTEVFQITKAVANFPCTCYLLGYDSKILVDSIFKELKVNGDDYLKKIVNIQFDLPPVSQSALQRMLAQALENTFGEAKEFTKNEINQFNSYLNAGVGALLRTPRTVKAITNHFRVSIATVENDVFWPDMLALSALYVIVPDVYRTIANNRSSFFEDGYGSYLETRSNERKKFHDSWISSVDPFIKKHVERIVSQLFPNAGINGIYRDRCDHSWRNENRIAAKVRFDCYFQHSLPEGKISGAVWKSFLTTITDEQATKDKLVEFGKNKTNDGYVEVSQVAELIERATAHVLTRSSSVPEIEQLLKALLTNEEMIVDINDDIRGGLFLLPTNNANRLAVLFYQALRSVAEKGDDDRTTRFMEKVIEWNVGLRTLTTFFANESRQIEKGHIVMQGKEYIVSENFPPIPLESVCSGIVTIRGRFETLAEGGQLEKRSDLDQIVGMWINIDSNEVAKKWLEQKVSDDPILFWKIIERSCLAQSSSGHEVKTYYVFRPSSVSFYLDLDKAKAMSERVLNEYPDNLNDEQKDLLRKIISGEADSDIVPEMT